MIDQALKTLISSKKEDTYYDFKVEYGSNVDLIFDIICLANAKHDGIRFLVIGIRNDFSIAGLNPSQTKQQNQIIDLLTNAHFVNGNIPAISLFNVPVENKTVQVITIENTRYKPYFLEKDKSESNGNGITGKVIRAGVVYSRKGCRNTSINSTASLYDIEYMWRERFGLDLSPLDRLSIYILDFDNWDNLDYETWFYKPFPEFTFKEANSEDIHEDSPWRWFFQDLYVEKYHISIFDVSFYYHATLIQTTRCIRQYDGVQFPICLPRQDFIKIDPNNFSSRPENTFYFYYLLKNNFDWKLLQFFYFQRKNIRVCNDIKYLTDERYGYSEIIKLPIFDNEKNKCKFISHIDANLLQLTNDETRNLNLNDNIQKDAAFGNFVFELWLKQNKINK